MNLKTLLYVLVSINIVALGVGGYFLFADQKPDQAEIQSDFSYEGLQWGDSKQKIKKRLGEPYDIRKEPNFVMYTYEGDPIKHLLFNDDRLYMIGNFFRLPDSGREVKSDFFTKQKHLTEKYGSPKKDYDKKGESNIWYVGETEIHHRIGAFKDVKRAHLVIYKYLPLVPE